MNEAIVILAAARGELKPLVRSWAALKTENGVEGWQHPSRPVFALCGGMGAAAATRAFAHARSICIPTEVISVGWAGSLQEGVHAGTVVTPTHVLDTKTGELFGPTDTAATLLLTTPRVADREEKRRLVERYPHAQLVDMEAAVVARLSLANGIPFSSMKAISDTFEEELPDLNPFIDARGQFQTARFALHAALHPRLWVGLSRFGKQADLAAKRLCETLARDLTIETR